MSFCVSFDTMRHYSSPDCNAVRQRMICRFLPPPSSHVKTPQWSTVICLADGLALFVVRLPRICCSCERVNLEIIPPIGTIYVKRRRQPPSLTFSWLTPSISATDNRIVNAPFPFVALLRKKKKTIQPRSLEADTGTFTCIIIATAFVPYDQIYFFVYSREKKFYI